MFTSPRGRRKIFLQHRKSIVGPQWIFPDVEVVRRCPRSAVSLMIVCAQTRFQTLVVDGLGRSQVGGPTRRLARSSGPVTATELIIEVAHGATRWHDGAGVAMSSCQWRRGDEPARPTFPLRWAQRAEDRERNGDRELPSRIRLSCRSPRALVGVPRGGVGAHGSEARSNPPREQY